MLVQRLTRFRLRSKVTIRAAVELLVYAAWDGTPAARRSPPPIRACPMPAGG